jgi:hypothetical protein
LKAVNAGTKSYPQGIVENGIESSFTAEQWQDWLKKNVV